MGLGPRISGGTASLVPGQPDPAHFEIIRSQGYLSVEAPAVLVAEIKYPDATTYEGRKILLWISMTIEQLERMSTIDPHFAEDVTQLGPCLMARFRPTPSGWKCAIALARAIAGMT